MKKKTILAFASAWLLVAAGTAFASYADDRAEIENISVRYMIAVDAGDIETVMATWADDGVLDWVRGVEHGKEAIRKAMSAFGGAAAAKLGTEGKAAPEARAAQQAKRRAVAGARLSRQPPRWAGTPGTPSVATT